MSEKLDVHNMKNNWQVYYDNLQKDEQIGNHNKQLITKFVAELLARGVSKNRVMRYIDTMRHACKIMGKELDTCKRDDLVLFVGELQNRNYTQWTRLMYKVMVRKFYQWLRNTGKDYPEEVKWIPTAVKKNEMNLTSADDLLTKDDMDKLIDVTTHPRDKALISVLYEGGLRIGELGNMRIKDVLVDVHGVLISVIGKTGPRKLRLISSTPFLMNWINVHPFRHQKDAPLWINYGVVRKNEVMQYRGISKLLFLAFKAAQIKKPGNPHNFRHSRATELAKHLTEFQMCSFFGWVLGSGMPATYVHLSGRDLDESILEINGIKTEQKEVEIRKPRICVRCNTINSHDATYCSKCAGFLDERTAIEKAEKEQHLNADMQFGNEVMNKLMAIPEVQEAIVNALKNIKV